MRWILLVLAACHADPGRLPAVTRAPPPPAPRAQVAAPVAPALPVEDAPSYLSDEPAMAVLVGHVSDVATKEALPGVTVIATARDLTFPAQTSITDEDGLYHIDELPPGDYDVLFYYADVTIERRLVLEDAVDGIDLEMDTREAIAGPIFVGCRGTIENTYIVDEVDTTGLIGDDPGGGESISEVPYMVEQ